MTLLVTISCDVDVDQWSTCGRSEGVALTGAIASVDQAIAELTRRGWIHGDRALCPDHSGRRPSPVDQFPGARRSHPAGRDRRPAVVVYLPQRPPSP